MADWMTDEQWDHAWEYINYLASQEEVLTFINKFERRDNKFYAEDIIRFYEQYLDNENKGKVKQFFLLIMEQFVKDLQNSKYYQDEPEEGYEEPESAVKAALWVTCYDLITESMVLIYDVIDVIRDLATGDVFAASRLFPLYERLIVLANNWHTYISYIFYKNEPLADTVIDSPWWQF